MGVIDDLVANNRRYVQSFERHLPVQPALRLTVVTCMDSRLDLFALLGLRLGDAHILRNAGGSVTDDTIRSLTISQRKLGTEEIMLIHHTDCGMQKITDDAFSAELESETGQRPPWPVGAFTDPFADIRASIAAIKANPFLPHHDVVRGFVFDVDTGQLDEVTP